MLFFTPCDNKGKGTKQAVSIPLYMDSMVRGHVKVTSGPPMFSPLAATNCKPIMAHELRCHSSLTGLNLKGHVLLCRLGVLVAAAQVRSFFL